MVVLKAHNVTEYLQSILPTIIHEYIQNLISENLIPVLNMQNQPTRIYALF